MSSTHEKYALSNILGRQNLVRLALIAATAGSVTATFAYAAGWLQGWKLTQDAGIDRLEEVNGVHPGFRRNHAKGVCIEGYFDSNGNGAVLSFAKVFEPGRIPVEGRFAVAVGSPDIPDSGKQVRSMALRFRPANGEEWRTGMNDIPVFGVRDAAGFYDQLLAMKPDPATGKADPAKVSAFLAEHPESANAIALINAKPFSSGFDNATYNGLNAFDFIAADGHVTSVRWSMQPTAPFEKEPADAPADGNYLFDELVRKIDSTPLRWHFLLTVGQPGDVTNDATIAWPDDRERIDAGVLTITGVEAEDTGNCRDINFDPLVLPDGIRASDDPLLSARSAAYAVSFERRAGEPHSPSAVQPDEVAKANLDE